MGPMIDARLQELESLYQTLAKANTVLAEVDSFDRWGRAGASIEEAARQDEAARGAGALAEKVTRELKERIARHREHAPDIIAQWVDAHVLLLDELLAREPAKRAAIDFEKEAWLRFGRGGPLHEPWPGSGVFVDSVRRMELLGA
jgi:hypothetical protein